MEAERDIFWDVEDLPRPTRDVARLKADMDAWGYCLLAEALLQAYSQQNRNSLLGLVNPVIR